MGRFFRDQVGDRWYNIPMAYIKRFEFENGSLEDIRGLKHNENQIGEKWPVVYVINDEERAYVGQTTDIHNRTSQHLRNPKKQSMTEIRIITDDDYNVSVALGLEAFLIQHINADRKYRLINGTRGNSAHNYYNRKKYEDEFRVVWEELRKLGVAQYTLEELENSEIFKYSPFKTLGDEQVEAELNIIRAFAGNDTGKGTRVIIRGGAGTGKTVLAVYLMKLFADIRAWQLEPEDYEDDYLDLDQTFIYAYENIKGLDKIGIVFPQKSLQTSMKDVFGHVQALDPSMVLNTNGVVDNYLRTGEKYDLLIVDEAHRLKSRNRGGNMLANKGFNDRCSKLGLDSNTASELDWILMCSRNQIIFRDDRQTVRAADMDAEEFNRVAGKYDDGVTMDRLLSAQWRCKGGRDYTDYVKSIMDCTAAAFREVENYDFRLYDDVGQMVEDIKDLERKYRLCRVGAGYAWKWKTKKDPNAWDIEIGDDRFRGNSTYDNWIARNAVDEIGCIHTLQGYDLNYVGVIIGNDIRYDKETGTIVADKTNYYDTLGKTGVADDPEALKEYLVNIYVTLMTRGIRGTYVYACDPDLREYLERFIPKA